MYSQQLVRIISIFSILFSSGVTLTTSQSDERHHRILFLKTVPPLQTACNATTVCIPLSRCATSENVRKAYPTVCGWEITEPRVCCEPPSNGVKQRPEVKTHSNLLSKEECAVQIQDSSARLKRDVGIFVVDGDDVNSNEKYPFIVGIYVRLGADKIFLCGGSLLSKQIVLTAAHCFDNSIETDTYVLRMGSIHFQPNSDFSSDFEFNVTDVVVHLEYLTPKLYHDIAILKFSGLESFTRTVRPLCLPDATSAVDTRQASVIGWGSTEFGGGSSAVLQEASIPIVHNTECNGTFWAITATRNSLPSGVIPSVICAGDKNSSKDACQGDSGGPLVFADAQMRWTQVGIVSGGIGCGTPGIPGIYTRVADYVDWIHSKL